MRQLSNYRCKGKDEKASTDTKALNRITSLPPYDHAHCSLPVLVALRFGPPEFVGLMFLGLIMVVYLARESLLKGLMMATIGFFAFAS